MGDDNAASIIDSAIRSLAVLIDDHAKFRAQAAVVAQTLGPKAIAELSKRFHSPTLPEPAGFGGKERGFGGWLRAWQFAIFELFFNYGTVALPVLRKTAFGKYDWTQGNAVEVLVRLAATGVEREKIIAEIRREFPRIRFEGTLYSVQPLLRHAAEDPAIAAIVRELEDLPAWKEAVDELKGPSP